VNGRKKWISKEEKLFEKILYIHNNPVTRGLVLTPQEWKWSCARWYSGERDDMLAIDDIIL